MKEATVTVHSKALSPLSVTDTRHLFRPVSLALVSLLDQLPPEAWQRPTIAGTWTVRDVVAHLIDGALRRLSFHRDRMPPPPPPYPLNGDRDFVAFINRLNSEWVIVSRRFSAAVLTRLFSMASSELAAFFESSALDAPALFAVSWAGERESEGWFDVGREFTELWHHQMQIRLGVGVAALDDPRFLRAVLDVSLRGLPHAYRDLRVAEASTIALDISGPSGGTWTLCRDAEQWTLWAGAPADPTVRVRMTDETAWRLLFHALPAEVAARAIEVDGPGELAMPLFSARSVIV